MISSSYHYPPSPPYHPIFCKPLHTNYQPCRALGIYCIICAIIFKVDTIKFSILLMNKLSPMPRAKEQLHSRAGFSHRRHLLSPVMFSVDSHSISSYMGFSGHFRHSSLFNGFQSMLVVSPYFCSSMSRVVKQLMRETTQALSLL